MCEYRHYLALQLIPPLKMLIVTLFYAPVIFLFWVRQGDKILPIQINFKILEYNLVLINTCEYYKIQH